MANDVPRKSLFRRSKRDPLKGHPIEDPYGVHAKLEAADFAASDLHELNLQGHHLRSMRHDGLTTLDQLRRKIKILPHQVKTAIKVLNEMGGRAIMADEVGLGKTIEAGIVLKELMARGKAHSVLIMTPAALATQWQQELWDKFGERFLKHDDPEFEGFSKHNKLVTSIDTAKSAQHYPEIIGREWDLVIIDEAHYLKNKKTQRYALADDIVARQCLMLTATPIQNNLMELYNLINLIRPGLLGTIQHFEEEYVGDNQGRVVLHAQRLQNLLKSVLIRNRRSETEGIVFPERRVETHRIEASEAELDLHHAVTKFIRDHKGQFESHLALMILEREVASSAPALSKTLKNMQVKVTDNETYMAMDDLRHQADGVKRNSKVNLVLDIAKQSGEKMIVFTQFRETQELLSRRLKQEGISNIKYHGQLTSGRRKSALDEFRGPDCQVLVCTDSGSEGLNLQFCHILVNYDLPWNPMRVEQRIGRVHRIGQESGHVAIINLAVANTIEDYVLQVLYEKIKLFEVAIGEMDLILSEINDSGGVEARIMNAILQSSSDKDVKDALNSTEREMASGRKKAKDIKQLDASIFQQFDLSTSNDEVDLEDKIDMSREVLRFLKRFVEVTGTEEETRNGVTTLTLPRTYWKAIGGVHTFTTDPQVFDDQDGDVELLSLGSQFLSDAMGLLDKDAAVGSLRTAEVDEPATLLFYRYFIETIRSEVEAFISVTVTDDGAILDVQDGLRSIPDGETLTVAPSLSAGAWAEMEENVRFEVGTIVQPVLTEKRDEAQEEVRRAERRLEEYFERQKDELRMEESQIRGKMGKIKNRLYFTENGVRERKLEIEHAALEKQLHDLTFKNNRRAEQLEGEMRDRLGREREKNEPRLKVELIGATRLLPHDEA
jgi:superfamily II DNA or RNA helicase